MTDTNFWEYIVEKSLIDLCIKVANLTDGSVENMNFYSYAKNTYSDWHNKVFNLEMPEAYVSERVETLLNDIKQGKAPKNLFLSSRTIKDKLAECLVSNNFSIFYEQTGMCINLDNFNDTDQDYSCNVKVIDSQEYVEEWVAAAGAAFGKTYNSELFKLISRENGFKLYACFIENKIAATAMTFECDNTVGIHMVGTLEKFRGLGLATNITKKIVSDSKMSGYKSCALQASKMGKSVYEKIGFIAVSKITHWKLNI